MACACGRHVDYGTPYPAVGIVLLSLADGSLKSTAAIGQDLVAVIVSGDGHTAFLADSSPGDVYAVSLPSLKVEWKQHTGGAPFGLLYHGGRVYVTLYDAAELLQLDPKDGAVIEREPTPLHPAAIAVDSTGLVEVATGAAFGIALAGGTLWTADYARSLLMPGGLGVTVQLPVPVHPFWLAPGTGSTLLIAAEGSSEDADPGAVLSYDTMSGAFKTLATPRDPDQVIQSGSTVLVAAHGERSVLSIGERTTAWASGAAAVALAPDPPLNLLVVAVNLHE